MQAGTTSMTIRLSAEANRRLEALAKIEHCSQADLVSRAIEEYLDLQEYQIQCIQEAVDEADSPHADFLDHDEVVKRLQKKVQLI